MSANDTSSGTDMTDSESQETDVNIEQEKEESRIIKALYL